MASYYVDPSGGSDATGDGSSGTPWKTVQHALDTITAAANDRINVRDTADDVLSSALSFATYGTPSGRLVIAGYTTTEDDGGIGGISGNSSVSIVGGGTIDNLFFKDMHLHSSGSAILLWLDNYCGLVGCEINGTSGNGIHFDLHGSLEDCYVHDCGGYGVALQNGSVTGCDFRNGTNDFTAAIECQGSGGNVICIERNTMSIDGASHGVTLTIGAQVRHNSILSSSGTGSGITDQGGTSDNSCNILNNLIDGFSGTGGKGIALSSSNPHHVYGYNYVNNCDTNYSVTSAIAADLGDNETQASTTPFDKSGSDTHANRVAYFSPADVGNVRAGAFPTMMRIDKGAIQHADPAAGGAGPVFRRSIAPGWS